MENVQILVNQENEYRIDTLLNKHGFVIDFNNRKPYDLDFGRHWQYVCIKLKNKKIGGNQRLDTTCYKLVDETTLIALLNPPKKKHQEATFTDAGEEMSSPLTAKEEIPMQNEIATQDRPMSTMDILIPRDYTVQEVFGFPSQIKIKGYEPGHPLVPTMDHTYVWDAGMAKDMIEWLSEDNPDPLWISGPTGAGKTDALKSVFSILNIPTVIVSAKASTEPDDILGRTQLRGGDTVFVPGDLLTAYARGYAIIFDEIDGYNPEVGMAIHRLLEREIVVLDDGTVIKPADRNLIAATANTRGDGHGGDLYASTKTFNLATMNRFEKWEMGYPAEEVEIKILTNAFGLSLDATLITAMVKTANDIRQAYLDGNCPGPMSVRDMLRWGKKLKQSWNRKDVSPVYHAFDKSMGNGVDPHVRAMLHTLVQTRFGTECPAIKGVS